MSDPLDAITPDNQNTKDSSNGVSSISMSVGGSSKSWITSTFSNTKSNASSTPNNDILGELSSSSLEWSTQKKDTDTLLPWEENNGKRQEDEFPQEAANISETKIIDINFSSFSDIVSFIADKEFDYTLIEPEESQVKITFRQDNIDKDIRYIKYAAYGSILLKIKQATDMAIDVSKETQEGKWKISLENRKFTVAAKTVPGPNGERIWLKIKADQNPSGKKQTKKVPISVIFGFLWAILLVWLILWATFVTFIVFNAKTVEDVRFFASLGINLNDINNFISQIVTLIFSILLFLWTSTLAIALFKFIVTKKSLKRRKFIYGILSFFLLLLTFGTGSAWMFIDNKIKSLPNWQEQAYWDLKIFDNDLRNSTDFWNIEALLLDTENLIWPATLLFDLENFQANQARIWFNVQKYIWDFGWDIEESFNPQITKTFTDVGNYPLSIIAIWNDINGVEIEKEIANVPVIGITHTIDVEETITNSWGKKVKFDASNLQSLWKIEWYFKEAITEENPEPDYEEWTKINEWYVFIPGKIFFDEMFVWLSIINGNTLNPEISKVVYIRVEGDSEITWEISYEQALDNELEFSLYVEDPKTDFSNGFIESYEWKINDKTYNIASDGENEETSPKIEHTFDEYGDQTINVILTDSTGKTQTLTKTINIQKRVQLRTPLLITNTDSEKIENLRVEEEQHEYFIDEIWVPTTVRFDARLVRPESVLYTLWSVKWDIWNDGNIDASWTSYEYLVATEWNTTIWVEYTFIHRRSSDDTITLKEMIYIEGVKKDAVLDLKIEHDSNYAPITVRFDASRSYIKNDDIVKFIYDYGDGVSEERDAINPWHIYKKAGDYNITLTVVWKSGQSYSTSKKLILLPPPQGTKISTSLKKAPIWQEIDFSSAESEGQIVEYFWEFGDGYISTEANPSHSYKSPWFYIVKLRADFANNNSITDEVEVEIVKK